MNSWLRERNVLAGKHATHPFAAVLRQLIFAPGVKLLLLTGLVCSGSASASPFPAELALSDLDGTNGFVIVGVNAGDEAGRTVSAAGDVNNDGFDDIIIGAEFADPNGQQSAGECYVVFGTDQGFASLELSALDGNNGFAINGTDSETFLGRSVSGIGDLNADGIDDLVVSANGVTSNGYTYVVFGTESSFPPAVDIALLDGETGFAVLNQNAQESGRDTNAVSGAGDINDDGIDDLIVSAPFASPNGQPRAGKSHVIFGSGQGFAATFDPSTLNGTNGFVINGTSSDDNLGFSVSGVGDVNNDGIDDLVVGAPWVARQTETFAGESYVVFGSREVFGAQLELSALDGSIGFVIGGRDGSDEAGHSVSGVADVNGDGIDDLIVGAPSVLQLSPHGEIGESYVVYGRDDGFPGTFELAAVDSNNGFVLRGIDAWDKSGYSVSGAGDINDDGFADIIVGAYNANANSSGEDPAGETYVVFGAAAGFPSALPLSALNGDNGFLISGIAPGDESGISVSGAGDVNGDGVDDLIIGAYKADPNGRDKAGESYVVFGRRALEPKEASVNIDGMNIGDHAGTAVSAIGDLNGDGKHDIVITAPDADPDGRIDAGESYVFFGTDVAPPDTLDPGLLDGTNGFIVRGVNAGDRTGISVGTGDLDGDGIDDLILGAPQADPDGLNNAGATYVVFGTTAFPPTLELSTLDGLNGFVATGGAADDRSGASVGTTRLNGDAQADLVIGAPDASPQGRQNAGAIYVVFGTDRTTPAVLDLSTLDGVDGFIAPGLQAFDAIGTSVAGAGNVNGDLMDDLIIGSPGASPGGRTGAGISHVVFGTEQTFESPFSLSALDGSNGFALNGVAGGDGAGLAVNRAGDLNDDGFGDLVIGAPDAAPDGREGAGESYVVFGTDSFPAVFELAMIDDANGVLITGANPDDRLGAAVAATGDVSNDNIDDLIVGAPGAGQHGESYLVFGTSLLGPTIQPGLETDEPSTNSSGFGSAVSGGGDFNKDGIADLIVGAPGANPAGNSDAGAAYLYYGIAPYAFNCPSDPNGLAQRGTDRPPYDQRVGVSTPHGDNPCEPSAPTRTLR